MIKFDGAFLVNKPKGITAHDVVFKLRKILNLKQIGHTGTLDPMATGLMLCLVGSSVKLSPYMGSENKQYQLTLELGKVTDSWDIAGKILEEHHVRVSIAEIASSIAKMEGEIDLEVPMYSAKKVEGKKLYEIAREITKASMRPATGAYSESPKADSSLKDHFKGPLKTMKFWDLKNIEYQLPLVSLSLWCSKGSFIRSWVFRIGEILKTGAVLINLNRIGIDKFSISQSESLEDIELQIKNQIVPKSYIPQSELIKQFETFELNESEVIKLRNGLISYHLEARIINASKGEGAYLFCTFNNQLVTILEKTPVLKIRKVFGA